MKREVKFRMWDGVIMRKDIIKVSKGKVFAPRTVDENGKYSKGFLMQYAGIKDVNGKDIYEGDILKPTSYDKGTKYVVEWLKTEFVATWTNNRNYSMSPSLNFRSDWEIIGNIYQNSK